MPEKNTTLLPGGQDGAHVAPVKPYDRTRAILSSRLPGTPRTVLLAIADHLSAPDGWCWPSVDRLAELSGRSASAVRRALRLLQSGSVLEVEEVRGRSSRYRVCWTALAAFGVCDSTHPSHFETPVILEGAPVILEGAPVTMTAEADQEADQEADHIHTPAETAPDLSPSGGTPDGVVCGPVDNPVENPVDNSAPQEDTSTEEITPSSEAPAPSHTSSDTPQQTLLQADGSAAAPPPADPIAALWASLEAIRREVDPGCKGWKLTGKRRTALGARLREHDAEEIQQVWRWWLTSTSPRAVYLREQGYTDETILRPSKFESYLALSWQAPTVPSSEAWESVVDALSYWKHIPPWISWAGSDPWAFEGDDNEAIRARYEAGILAAGGAEDIGTAWRNLYRLASAYDRNQQRRAFLGAWSRSSLREVA